MAKEKSEEEFEKPTRKKLRKNTQKGRDFVSRFGMTRDQAGAPSIEKAAYREASPTRRAARKALRKGETTRRGLASYMSPEEEADELARIEREGVADLHALLPGQVADYIAKDKARRESPAMIDPEDEAELLASPVEDVVTADERRMASFGGPTPEEEQELIDAPVEMFDPRAARESAAKTALSSVTEPGELDVSAEDPSMFAKEADAPSEPQIVKGAGDYDYQMDPVTKEITIVGVPEDKKHLVGMKLRQGKAYNAILAQEFGGMA